VRGCGLRHQKEKHWDYFSGLDLSIKNTSICIAALPSGSARAEIVSRSLSGSRLMGPRNFLLEDIQQLQNALAAYSLASKQEEDVPIPFGMPFRD
jgi:hypothetical protein